MPVGIIQPSNQIKFTNVSVVRLKKGKKRFELACYKNKLLEYRSGTETDLDNVLQIPTVFLSVSKAQTAPTAELSKAFGPKTSNDEIIQEILRKGEVQVGERERKDILERVEKEVLEIVSARLVDPVSKRVYTTGMISKALDQLSAASGQQGGGSGIVGNGARKGKTTETMTAGPPPAAAGDALITTQEAPAAEEYDKRTRKPTWTGVVTNKSAKSQALDAMKALIAWQPIPVMRARMRLRITCPTSILKQAVKSASGSGGANYGGGGGGGGDQPTSPTKGGGQKKGKGGHAHSKAHDEGYHVEAAAAPKATGTVKDRILSYFEQVEEQDVLNADEWEVIGFAEPGAFKGLSEFIGGETKGKGRVEVLDMTVTHEE
ncbi:SBDS family rRNA metabolism protein [Paracoccidioides brasiliensis Pb18]|uniref:SBDS family rRNA metabolism protein n=1 Tax=Paracoccidioides brasiliensis (strain Pb18) TaxID=502780 RepID=C1GG78_PARBD|nr:SBDS family rRNA metabolism protein [Paracoccidioides brasiliensis Pb18]EEH50236.1 SBDS family rRNA metabolism protein [Paracoccidioides brasiliensis Pb18]